MGLFDTVKFEVACPHCGSPVTDFQTKDGPQILSTVYPGDVINFYSSCDNKACDAWVDCRYVPPQGVGKIVVTATRNRWGSNKDKPMEEKILEIEYDINAKKGI